MLVWYIQLCVNTMPRRRDIGTNLRAFVATQQSGSSYKAIFKQFEFYNEKDYSQVSIQEISRSFSSLQIHPKIKKTEQWLQKKRVKVLQWSSQTVDLNLWHDLKGAVHKPLQTSLKTTSSYRF